MKTIKTLVKNTNDWKRLPVGTLLRVRDEDATRIVKNKEGSYAPKSEWKKKKGKQNETND